MYTRYTLYLIALFSLLTSSVGQAQSFADPASVTGGRTRIAPLLSVSSVDYQRENGSVFNLERTTVGTELSHGFGKTFDGVATLGLALDSKVNNLPKDDGGFSLGFGGRGVVFRQGQAGVVMYGFFNWMRDQFKSSGDLAYELTSYDLRLGSTFSVALEGRFQPFIGLDLAMLRGGTEQVNVGGLSVKSDLEKDDVIGLKLGMNILVGSVMLRPEATLLGEQTFTFAAGFLL